MILRYGTKHANFRLNSLKIKFVGGHIFQGPFILGHAVVVKIYGNPDNKSTNSQNRQI